MTSPLRTGFDAHNLHELHAIFCDRERAEWFKRIMTVSKAFSLIIKPPLNLDTTFERRTMDQHTILTVSR